MKKVKFFSILIVSILAATATSQAVSIDIYATGVDNNHSEIIPS